MEAQRRLPRGQKKTLTPPKAPGPAIQRPKDELTGEACAPSEAADFEGLLALPRQYHDKTARKQRKWVGSESRAATRRPSHRRRRRPFIQM